MWAKVGRRLWLKATSLLACVVAALAIGCADEPRAIDPTRLPESVDVGPLRGSALSKTPCTFSRELAGGSPGSGIIRVWLDCARSADREIVGFVEVARAPTGGEPVEDSIRCQGDPRLAQLQTCRLRHGMITIDTRASCAPARCSSEEEARELMARVMALLATLPEQPCRLCPEAVSPQEAAQVTRTFSGTGPQELGTIVVPVDARLRYVALERGIRVTTGDPAGVLIDDARQHGEADIPRGTYRDVRVISSGRWDFLIEPR
jgi:hypothetical protein